MRRSVAPSVIAVVALAVTLALIVLGTAPPSASDDPSSRVAGKAGTLALYNWLGSLGFTTHRISGQFALDGTDVLVMVDPTAQLTEADAAAAMRLLGAGGDVIIAVSPATVPLAQPLLSALHVSVDIARSPGDSVPAQPFDAGDRVHHVPMTAGSAIDPAPFLTPLLTQDTTITAVAERVRDGGRAYVVASPFPFSNDGLRDGDSAALVLSLLERARGGAIGFDEYHHGEQATSVNGASAIFQSPLGLALALGVIAVVVYLALSGRRIGRPVAATDVALVPSTGSYVTAMARLYARSRDRGVVASRYADELKQRLGRSAGIDPGTADEAFAPAVGAYRREFEAEVRSALARARALSAGDPDAAALLSLARDVDDLERRWSEPAAAVVATAQ